MKNIIKTGNDFWNFRGSFRVAGVDIGTQTSLVKRGDGSFVLLDAYSFTPEQLIFINKKTNNGEKISAVINLHPFHTLHVEAVYDLFPDATHYGTVRHKQKFPDIPWASMSSEELEEENLFADDLEFSVPKGVDFISSNEQIHFSSVLAYHPSSKTIHSDDTLMVYKSPLPMAPTLTSRYMNQYVQFHPTLAFALEKREGASNEFTLWADDINGAWGAGALNLCAAHSGALVTKEPGVVGKKMRRALSLVKPVLSIHKLRYK